ncbi:N-acetylmuramoyl-L-alanine amidase [Niabella hirudinis]|uniref:N-acetylmuramoyl-L-alanine amidase n=1 Tax=Niabella hirudinis TaxID=1285929 RepID=UPI003EBD4B2D
MPSKRNILSTIPNARGNTAKQQNLPPQTNQTVFKTPEQKPPPSEIASKASFEAPAPLRYKPFISKNTNINPEALVYGSPQYYLYRADSLQKTYSRKIYYDNLQTIIDQISATPDDKLNPAVNTDNWYAAIDFNIRKPHFIILHHTGQNSVEQTLFTFSFRKKLESSAHYVVSRDGAVYQMLNDYVRSYHAGAGKWGNISDMNSCSLGIEIDNNGEKDLFTSAQINALIKLLTYLKEKYSIPTGNIIGHSDFAPMRKNDPSVLFPWSRLALAGFGYWYDINNLKEPPPDFNPLLALRVIGYDISVPEYAIIGFKRHFIQNNESKTLSDYEKKIIYNIMLKYE